jgi:DNA-binding transcriptional ArsR family regulator
VKENSEHVIASLDELKAISHPLRLEILKQLIGAPMTTAEVATALGEKVSKLYYHVAELEKYGLIHVVETRQKGNLTEKVYRPRAGNFRVDAALLQREGAAGAEALCVSVAALFDATLLDLRRLSEAGFLAGPRMDEVQRSHMAFRLSHEQLDEFRRRLRALIEETNALDHAGAPAEIALTLVAYPRPRKP